MQQYLAVKKNELIPTTWMIYKSMMLGKRNQTKKKEGIYLYKVQQVAKLIFGDKCMNSGYFWEQGKVIRKPGPILIWVVPT